MAIFFITGTSGSGKTTLKEHLMLKLPQNQYEIYDFDENGVPENADATWRQKTTDYWLTQAQANHEHHKSTIICGVSVPSEVMNSVNKPNLPIYFGFLKVADDVIRLRLEQREWSDQLIQNNLNWAHSLEAEVRKYQHFLVVETLLNNSSEQIANQVVSWIQSPLKKI